MNSSIIVSHAIESQNKSYNYENYSKPKILAFGKSPYEQKVYKI